MSNELLEICRRLECDSVIDPKGIWIVTYADKRDDGGWELRVQRQQEETEGTNDNN